MRALLAFGSLCLLTTHALAGAAPSVVLVNAAARHLAISPLIYGVAFASQADLVALNAPLTPFVAVSTV